MWGLHFLDLAIIAIFLIAVLSVGLFLSRSVKKESDFYLGGRRLGRVLQFFLNFGNSTDSTGAVQVAAAVYQQGAGGIWVGGFQTLFITPFFWFTQPWWRRTRLITMGDLFVDRFNSKALACCYAAFSIFMALYLMGMGNFFTFRFAQAMIVKPESQYNAVDRLQIQQYRDYLALRSRIEAGEKSLGQSERFRYLDNLSRRGELQSSISFIRPAPFYIAYSAIVGIYIVLGGLRAAAITDAVQGLLIMTMSVLLIPVGLHRLGGLHQLHQIVPAKLFTMTSQNTWYSIAAITFGSLIQIFGLMHNMSTAGSATNENTARFGMISGGFTKRLVLIACMFCGLIGVAILQGNLKLADPDNAWGALTRQLLGPGLLGIMISGMLLGHMPSVGVYAVSVAGLVTRNLYEPLVKGKSQAHYLRVGQLAIVIVLIVAIFFALGSSNVISAYTMLVTFNTFFGAAIFLILFWRRLTARSILIGLGVWVVVMGLIPWVLPQVPSFRRQSPLLLQTSQFPQSAVFFDQVARIDPRDPNSPLEGIGRFNVENYCLHLLAVPVERFSPAGMTAVRWGFDGLFPFVVLIVLSLLTKPDSLDRADRFFAKMRTPVAPTPDLDVQEVKLSFADPHRFDHKKILPGSNWQFCKWKGTDMVGFLGCWVIVGLILLVLWSVLNLGS
jgi:Na+/proline symporter